MRKSANTIFWLSASPTLYSFRFLSWVVVEGQQSKHKKRISRYNY